MNWSVVLIWGKGLLAAFISAAANGITATIIAPEAFNFGAQWKQTLIFAGVNGGVAAAAYLKQSPLPEAPKTEEIK